MRFSLQLYVKGGEEKDTIQAFNHHLPTLSLSFFPGINSWVIGFARGFIIAGIKKVPLIISQVQLQVSLSWECSLLTRLESSLLSTPPVIVEASIIFFDVGWGKSWRIGPYCILLFIDLDHSLLELSLPLLSFLFNIRRSWLHDFPPMY